ncbi:MAG: FAD-dependent oxidoreductase [Propionibacteriaceae bacterium]
MDPVIVVGAGISGIAAARTLHAAGLPVLVLDRGRRIGGRMGVRTVDDRPIDIGASYFTVSDPAFQEVVDDWQERGLARPWTDTFHVYADGALTPKSGPMRWAAPTGLRSLVEDLADGLDVQRETVLQIEPGPCVDEKAAGAVILAMPDPQAERLLHPSFGPEIEALTDAFAPVLVLTAAWDQRDWPAVDGVFVSDDDTLTWIADDGRRRGDDKPILVAHSTSPFAAAHLEDPTTGEAAMLAALQRVLGIESAPTFTQIQRWSFAKPAGTKSDPYFLGDSLIGLCGDSWSDKPRVESAFLSGTALGEAISRRLS